MNVVNLIGRLTAKPELRHTNSGKAVCRFSVAVNGEYKDADGNDEVVYINCVAWESRAEFICKWFDKGVRMGISGKLHPRQYEKDGQTHYVTDVLVKSVEFADGKRDINNTEPKDDFIPVDDNDLPFG